MKFRTLLLADVGNTSVTVGLFKGGRVLRTVRIPSRIRTAASVRAAIAKATRGRRAEGAALCSVVPAADRIWAAEMRRASHGPFLQVHHKLRLGIGIDYPKPSSIGADRLANAVGAVFSYGAPVIVADFGTALTLDVINPDRAYVGGVIMPGLPLMLDYLAERTALLPHIAPAPVTRVVGRSTREAMLVGAQHGYRGMVKEMVRELRREPGLARARLVGTGGYAEWVLQGLKPAMILDPNLTLFGIGCIYELNRFRAD